MSFFLDKHLVHGENTHHMQNPQMHRHTVVMTDLRYIFMPQPLRNNCNFNLKLKHPCYKFLWASLYHVQVRNRVINDRFSKSENEL